MFIQDPLLETEPQKLKYPCSKCDESFNLKVDLKVHMMTHPNDQEHVCTVCNKSFSEARILRRHSKIHLEKKPHQCDQCDMSFAESSNLSKHKKKHTGELRNIEGKPHLCSYCGRAFKWASSLSKHMKYHTGHKLLSCDYCGKQYVEVKQLKNLLCNAKIHRCCRPEVCEFISGRILEKDLTHVIYVRRHSHNFVTWKSIFEYTQGRSLSYVLYVGKGKPIISIN